MGVNIHDPLVQIKVTESVCGFVAISMTLLRLWLRRARYWWDDACALFSFLSLVLQFGAVFMHVEHPSDLSRLTRIASYYLMATTFYTIIWSARLAILFSIIRIDPDPIMRRRLMWLAAVFVSAICFFLAQLFWTCEGIHNGWKNKPSPQCPLPKQIAICQLVSDVLADLALMLLPIRLIRGIKDNGLRWRLILIFSTSIVTTVVSLVHAAYIITRGGIPVIISALVEDCMSLTVANLPVVATASIRHLSGVNARDANPDVDGQRWSSFKVRTRSHPPGATTHGPIGFGLGSNTELTFSTLGQTKTTMPAYAVGSEELFAGTKPEGKLDDDGEKARVFTQVRREDRGVVLIDMLPYPPQPPATNPDHPSSHL
ncbi:hypothetical protein F5148DRAFT_50113 [Russula earlei]|uniref:Uncharacterized protein n=1 Tax=Russula earlei TaxID=71964 RepID=A0ACC0U852_9AGAM|nr:hypothetical protein F5148DRAFT_50113 [Russula earlei]